MDTIAAFKDFMMVARAQPMSDPSKIQNEATKYRRHLLRKMLSGLTDKVLFQSGSTIEDYIQLEMTSNKRNYLPTDDFNYQPTASMTKLSVPWRFTMSSAVWYDHEILLSGSSITETFKKVKDIKMQEMESTLMEGMEEDLWAAPNAVEMEGGNTTGRDPYSLPCFITEDGLAPSSTNSGPRGISGADWSTLMTVSPAAKSNWRNQVETYDATSRATMRDSLPTAFDLMWDDVQYFSPTTSQQYAQDTNIQKLTILTTRNGYGILLDILRNLNDRTVVPGDFGKQNGSLTYNGLPIERIGAMENLAYVAGQPRFWFVNFQHIRPIFHSQRYMFPKEMDGGAKQPNAHVHTSDTYRQLWCQSRRQQGIIRPA